MGHAKSGAERPLSPHLSIYRPMLTMMMSIAHRISGVGNSVGFLLLAWWLLAIASGPARYAQVSGFFASIAGRTLLFLFTWSLIHHMLGGVRHLIWDTGQSLDPKSADGLAWLSVIASLVTTVVGFGKLRSGRGTRLPVGMI